MGQQFQDPDFPGLSGARIVRIATHPELTRSGYGSRAVAQLAEYFQGHMQGLGEEEGDEGEGDGEVRGVVWLLCGGVLLGVAVRVAVGVER